MKIGLLGLTYASGNKGCEALSYSCLELLNRIAMEKKEEMYIYIIGPLHFQKIVRHKFNIRKMKQELIPRNDYKKDYPYLKIDTAYYKKYKNRFFLFHKLKKCNCVIDFTAGDSFTDIYGKDRFFQWTDVKRTIIENDIPLVFGSQTIGPFLSDKAKSYASDILQKSKAIFVRDEMSYEYTKQLCKKEPILTTDVAFLLPYKQNSIKSDKIKVGINPSGLLWNRGYTGKNEFGLTVDYQKYCRTVIHTLLDSGKYEVHLILHAYCESTGGYPDNDLDAVVALHKEYPETVCSPYFKTPMEAKSYISAMDIFTGARMHATIASFSSGVAVIPFSYSRKFEGLFNSLGYDYIIHGLMDTTEVAIENTIAWIGKREMLKEKVNNCLKIANRKIVCLVNKTEEVLYH